MFTFDRDTAMIVAVIMCIAASVYMYKELKTPKKKWKMLRVLMEK